MENEKYLTSQQMAEEFGPFFSESRLRFWRWQGYGPPVLRIGRRRLYRRSDVLAWIESNMAAGKSTD
jgi:DNA-binding transcriptional MerR regulator